MLGIKKMLVLALCLSCSACTMIMVDEIKEIDERHRPTMVPRAVRVAMDGDVARCLVTVERSGRPESPEFDGAMSRFVEGDADWFAAHPEAPLIAVRVVDWKEGPPSLEGDPDSDLRPVLRFDGREQSLRLALHIERDPAGGWRPGSAPAWTGGRRESALTDDPSLERRMAVGRLCLAVVADLVLLPAYAVGFPTYMGLVALGAFPVVSFG